MARSYKNRNYRRKAKIPLSQIVAGSVSLFLLSYFAYHLVYGELGVFSMRRETARLEAAKIEHEQLEDERIGFENRVKRLRSDSLDLDVLDERSRDVLGYVKEEEVIIINK